MKQKQYIDYLQKYVKVKPKKKQPTPLSVENPSADDIPTKQDYKIDDTIPYNQKITANDWNGVKNVLKYNETNYNQLWTLYSQLFDELKTFKADLQNLYDNTKWNTITAIASVYAIVGATGATGWLISKEDYNKVIADWSQPKNNVQVKSGNIINGYTGAGSISKTHLKLPSAAYSLEFDYDYFVFPNTTVDAKEGVFIGCVYNLSGETNSWTGSIFGNYPDYGGKYYVINLIIHDTNNGTLPPPEQISKTLTYRLNDPIASGQALSINNELQTIIDGEGKKPQN